MFKKSKFAYIVSHLKGELLIRYKQLKKIHFSYLNPGTQKK